MVLKTKQPEWYQKQQEDKQRLNKNPIEFDHKYYAFFIFLLYAHVAE